MLSYIITPSPLGKLKLVASPQGLRALFWENDVESFLKIGITKIDKKNEILQNTAEQLNEYFKGQRQKFNLPLDPIGTQFQLKAWQALRKIPYGKTWSYAEQAEKINNPKAVRAIGGANGKNPISIIVPCHRVIGKNGSLTGFGGGLTAKEFLLNLEKKYS